jgi:hypothetical protein
MRHICTFLFFAINAPQVKHICLSWGLLNFLESNGSCPRCRQYSVHAKNLLQPEEKSSLLWGVTAQDRHKIRINWWIQSLFYKTGVSLGIRRPNWQCLSKYACVRNALCIRLFLHQLCTTCAELWVSTESFWKEVSTKKKKYF